MVSKQLNPVIIAGYDVIYLGRKGFATIAKANRAMVRPKGAPKDTPWKVISFGKLRKKFDKEELLSKTLKKLTKKDDEAAEKKLREIDKVVDKAPAARNIKFKLEHVSKKLVKTQQGFYIETAKYFFNTNRAFQFVNARDMNVFTVRSYMEAVKKEFLEKVFKIHKRSDYLIRLYHDYEGLPSTPESDPLDRGFSGLGLNRQEMGREDVDEQFRILDENYFEAFSRYLVFARSNTYFRFTGFTAEVTLKKFGRHDSELTKRYKKGKKTKKSKKLKKNKKSKKSKSKKR